MDDIHAHKHIMRRKGVTKYTTEVPISEPSEGTLDVRLVKLIFVAMVAVVAYGISFFVFAL